MAEDGLYRLELSLHPNEASGLLTVEGGDAKPEVVGLWVAEAVGHEGEIAGVRDLTLLGTGRGEELHLVTGNVTRMHVSVSRASWRSSRAGAADQRV